MAVYEHQPAPGGYPPELEFVVQYMQEELKKIELALREQDILQLKTLHAAPAKPREGNVVLADGTDWNPGSGAGFYGYYGGTWVKLG